MANGIFEIFIKSEWIRFDYLQNRVVLKICSFFNFTYGTTTLEGEFHNYMKIKLITTIDCLSNVTNFRDCKIKDPK